MRAILIGTIFLLKIYVFTQAQFRYATNKVQVKQFTLPSKILGEDRKIDIYKPEIFPEYKDVIPPVIYVLDGDAYTEHFVSIVNMICERLVQSPPIMVVGIENYKNARDRDFESTDGSAKFLRFINDEVIPFAEKDYKQRPFRVVTGHSSSAYFAMKVFFKQPSLFNGYLLSSFYLVDKPEVSLADSSLKVSAERNNTLFLSSGIEDWAQESVARLDSFLKRRFQKGLSYQIKQYPAESHYTVYLKSFCDGFHYIFRLDPAESLKAPEDITIQLYRSHYKKLNEIFGVPVKPLLTLTGEYATNFSTIWKDLNKALDFYKENADNYPGDASAQADYANALLKKGDKKMALARYEAALALNPADNAIKEKIETLKRDNKK